MQLAGPAKSVPRKGTRVRHAIKKLQDALGDKQAAAAEAQAAAGGRKPRGRGRAGATEAAEGEAAEGQEAESGGLDTPVALLLSASRDARRLPGRSAGAYARKSSF